MARVGTHSNLRLQELRALNCGSTASQETKLHCHLRRIRKNLTKSSSRKTHGCTDKSVSASEQELTFTREPPVHIDYGTNIMLGKNVFINFNSTILDTCKITIGARTLVASNVSLFSGTHPLDPDVRNGTKGPEDGAEIHIEEDCWLGGSAIILPGIRIGRGSTVGAGSVVTKVYQHHIASWLKGLLLSRTCHHIQWWLEIRQGRSETCLVKLGRMLQVEH